MSVPILRRDELLNLTILADILKNAENKTVAIIDLKSQAKSNNIPIREFSTLIKEAEYEPEKSIEIKEFTLPNKISNVIINTGDYIISETGINLTLGNNIIEVCPHPIFPISIMKDIETGEEKIQIAFYKKNLGWTYNIILDRTQIATTKGIVGLSKYGIMANDENSRYLVKYFCDIEMMNIDKLKTVKCCGYLGKTEYGWIPYSKDIVYNMNDKDCLKRYNLYHEKGSYEIWLEWQNKICDYTIPKICIATAYASLLTETFGLNPFAVHLWGETGKGKSVAILSSASVYGYPDIKNGIVYTGNTTANGLEPRLAFVRNFTFYLDELSMQTKEQIDRMIYLAMQGQGKARMSQGAKAQDTYYWFLCTLSNSEMPITNDYSKGGIYNRIIQISPKGKIFGDMDMPEICNIFKSNYGFGAKRFIDLLEDENIVNEIKILKNYYYSEFIKTTEDKQANSASILITAYEIARKYIYKSDKELNVEEVIPYLFTNEEISQVMRVYKKFGNYVQANYKMFDESDINTQQKWGKIADGYVHILPYRLEEFCQKINIDMKQFIIGLKERNIIKHCNGRNTNRYRIFDNPISCYSILLPLEPITNNGNIEKIEDLKVIETDILPF